MATQYIKYTTSSVFFEYCFPLFDYYLFRIILYIVYSNYSFHIDYLLTRYHLLQYTIYTSINIVYTPIYLLSISISRALTPLVQFIPSTGPFPGRSYPLSLIFFILSPPPNHPPQDIPILLLHCHTVLSLYYQHLCYYCQLSITITHILSITYILVLTYILSIPILLAYHIYYLLNTYHPQLSTHSTSSIYSLHWFIPRTVLFPLLILTLIYHAPLTCLLL